MIKGEDIQVENGRWTRIHNSLLEAIALLDIDAHQYKVLLLLIRLTYGYNRKEVEVGSQELGEMAKIDPSDIRKAISRLEERNIITKKGGGKGRGKKPTLGLNKYVETWKGLENGGIDPILDTENGVTSPHFTEEENGVTSPHFNELKWGQNGGKNGVTSPHYTSGLKTVKTEEEKTVAEEEAPPPPKKEGRKVSDFVKAYERVWGKLVESPYIGQQIQEWEARITLEGWVYSLEESAKANVKTWKYLGRILERVEREGVKAPQVKAPPPLTGKSSGVVDFSIKDFDL